MNKQMKHSGIPCWLNLVAFVVLFVFVARNAMMFSISYCTMIDTDIAFVCLLTVLSWVGTITNKRPSIVTRAALIVTTALSTRIVLSYLAGVYICNEVGRGSMAPLPASFF